MDSVSSEFKIVYYLKYDLWMNVYLILLFRIFPEERSNSYAQTSCSVYGIQNCPGRLLSVANVQKVAEILNLESGFGELPKNLLIDATKRIDGKWIDSLVCE